MSEPLPWRVCVPSCCVCEACWPRPRTPAPPPPSSSAAHTSRHPGCRLAQMNLLVVQAWLLYMSVYKIVYLNKRKYKT